MTKIRKVSPENPEGITRDMTPEEQASYDADVVRLAQIETDRETEKQARIDLKASAKTKLMAGEPLTEEEADVMLGG
tara:strand:+ start:396 stop:626 length:231 start_codon:yes stop_codon:yes gene_type:complete